MLFSKLNSTLCLLKVEVTSGQAKGGSYFGTNLRFSLRFFLFPISIFFVLPRIYRRKSHGIT
jgi:hypothetical protein